MFSTCVEQGTFGLQQGCEVRKLQRRHRDKKIWVFSLTSWQAQMKMFHDKICQISCILWMQIIPKSHCQRKRWIFFFFFFKSWIYQTQVMTGFDITGTQVKLCCHFLALVQLCLWRKTGPYGSIWKKQKVLICGKVPPTGGIVINLVGPVNTRHSSVHRCHVPAWDKSVVPMPGPPGATWPSGHPFPPWICWQPCCPTSHRHTVATVGVVPQSLGCALR